jgi:hypothetical protein
MKGANIFSATRYCNVPEDDEWVSNSSSVASRSAKQKTRARLDGSYLMHRHAQKDNVCIWNHISIVRTQFVDVTNERFEHFVLHVLHLT